MTLCVLMSNFSFINVRETELQNLENASKHVEDQISTWSTTWETAPDGSKWQKTNREMKVLRNRNRHRDCKHSYNFSRKLLIVYRSQKVNVQTTSVQHKMKPVKEIKVTISRREPSREEVPPIMAAKMVLKNLPPPSPTFLNAVRQTKKRTYT